MRLNLNHKADKLLVELVVMGSARVLLEGELYGKVLSWDNGSFWELVKEGSKTVRWAGGGGGGSWFPC